MDKSLSRLKIAIIGAGNAACHLGNALVKSGMEISTIYNRNGERGRNLAKELKCKYTDDLNELTMDDLIVIAVSDSAIPEILSQLSKVDGTIVHTSGSVGINVLRTKTDSYGVLYPFQTLTAGIEVDFRNVPLCIEASDLNTLELIMVLAEKLSGKVYKMNSVQRKKLHLSGVVANNFSNHLFALAGDYLRENDLDPELLIPLITETVNKLSKTSAENAQTGPARRNNIEIIDDHLAMLEDKPELKNLYSLISDSIIAYYSSF